MADSHDISYPSTHKAFTLTELLVVVSILTVLAGLISSATHKARENAKTRVCTADLRQLGQALQMYASDNDARYPMSGYNTDVHPFRGTFWCDVITPYIHGPFPTCPTGQRNRALNQYPASYRSGYGFNAKLDEIAAENVSPGRQEVNIPDPADTVVIADMMVGLNRHFGPDIKRSMILFAAEGIDLSQSYGAERHLGGANYLLADGHVTWLSADYWYHKTDKAGPTFTVPVIDERPHH